MKNLKLIHLIKQFLFVIALSVFLFACSGAGNTSTGVSEKSAEGEVPPTSKTKKTDVTSEVASEKTEGDAKATDKPVEEIPAGILTAGEWNDLDHWDFWLNLLQSDEWKHLPEQWQFNTEQRISVYVENTEGKPLNNIEVRLKYSSGTSIWIAKTDNHGRAELWPGLFQYNQETKFTVSIIQGNGEEKQFNNISVNKKSLRLKVNDQPAVLHEVDVMFVVDATGSMGDELEFLKTDLQDIIMKVKERNTDMETRAGMVFYRDNGDEYLTRNFDFNSNIEDVMKNLRQQSAGGGGDYEEAVETALQNALKQTSWSDQATARILFLILDAPPRNEPAVIKQIQNTIKMAALKGVKIIPIAASGIDKSTEFLMRFLAVSTNGTYVFITDDSGVGNAHLEPTVGRYQVEKLNELLTRLIAKYTRTIV